MLDLPALTLGTLIIVAAAVIATLAARPWRTEASRLAALPAVGLIVGFIGTLFVVVPQAISVFPPSPSWQWLVWALVPLLLAAVLEAVIGPRTMLRWIAMVLFAVVSLLVLGIGRLKHPGQWAWNPRGWSGAESAEWLGLAIVAVLLMTISSAVVARKVNPRAVLAGWLVAAGLLGPVLAILGSFSVIGPPAGMFAMGVAALFLLMVVFRKFEPGLSVWLALSVLYVGLTSTVMDPWHGRLSVDQAIPVLLAPLGIWTALLADRSRWWPAMVVTAIAVIAIAAWPLGTTIDRYLELRSQGLA